MAITAYGPYSIVADIPSGKVDVGALDAQIRESNIKTALSGIERSGDVLSVTFKDILDATDKALLDGSALQAPNHPCTAGSILGDHTGEPVPDQQYTNAGNPVVSLEKVQKDGSPLVALTPRVTGETIYATHNYTDPTTWYSQSARVTDEAAVDVGAGLVWNLVNNELIDLVHGKIFDEEGVIEDQQTLNPGDPNGYATVVRVNAVEQTARPPFATDWSQGGDYYVDYAAGTINFQLTQAGQNVRVDYSHAQGSSWILIPITKALSIEKSEIQFSADVDMKSTIDMKVMGPVETFAPDYWDQQAPVAALLMPQGSALPQPSAGSAGGLFYENVTPQLYVHDGAAWQPIPPGPLPSGYVIPLETTLYKSIDQLVDEAIGAYPAIPVFTNTAPPRGYTQAKHIFQFYYGAAKRLFPSLGMQLHIMLDGDVALGGERATATFYMTAEADPGPMQAAKELGIG